MLNKEYEKIVKSLNKFFNIFNKELFDGELKDCVVTVQTNGRSKNTMGWFTVGKMWDSKTEEAGAVHEINLAAEFLDRPSLEILVTLLHEMIHLYCQLNKIQDTSRNGRWHNKKFKQESEDRLMNVEKRDGIGWSRTTATEELEALINANMDEEDTFTIYRKREAAGLSKPKQRIFKYECLLCGGKVRGSKELAIMCCDEEMEVTTNI